MCLTQGTVHFKEKGRMCPYIESGPFDRRTEDAFQVSLIHIDSPIKTNWSCGD